MRTKHCLAAIVATSLVCASFALAATVDTARLDRAFAQLQSYNWGQPADALLGLDETIAATHGDTPTRRQLELRLIVILETNAPVAAKQWVCRRLAIIGNQASVPALAALLTNDELSHPARIALERIPDAAAATALRDALPKARGKTKVGIINSLGVLADTQATSALTVLLGDSDSAIAGAAAIALGKIGSLEAARALDQFRATAPKTLQPLANEAYIASAEKLVRRGQRPEAARIFRQLYADTNSESLRLAGFRGLLLAEPWPEPAIPLVARALIGDDEPLRSLAGRILAEAPGAGGVIEPFLRLCPSLPPAGQVTLLDAIRLRRASPFGVPASAGPGSTEDRLKAELQTDSRPAVLVACDSPEPGVRLAALRALGMVGNAEDVPRLGRLAAAGSGDESAAARLALANLPGREPSSAMLAALPDAQPPLRVELIKALAARFATEAAPALANQLKDSDESVRHAALEALAVLGDEKQAPAVIVFLKSVSDDAARRAAEQTLDAIVARAGANSLDALLAGLKDASDPSRIVLLQQLGRRGGAQALAAVRAAASGGDAQVRDAAFRVLTTWPDAEAAPDLLKFAQQAEEPSRRALAFRGYVRLCREARMPASERLTRLSEAVGLAANTEEKMLMASALADAPAPGSLTLLAGYLEDAALVGASSLAAVKVASALDPKYKDEAVPVLQQVLQRCPNVEVQRQAREILKKLGVPAN